jgi:hypothetical protein
MALPALGSARPESLSFAQASSAKPNCKLVHGTLGKTGLKVTRMAFGCMTTSDGSVIQRAADALRGDRPEASGSTAAGDPPALLPHVRQLQRHLSRGPPRG